MFNSLLGLRQGGDSARQDARAIGPLLWRVLIGAFMSVALLVGVDAFATWLSRFFHFGSLFAPVTSSSYVPLASAGVGALAVFLALFFTTVGVIASTAYVKVPGEIRQLFVKERTSTFYIFTVVIALVYGTVLLTFPVVSGRDLRGLTVIFFWFLTIASILSLAILGRSLFNFFDPSTLARRLYPQFLRAVRRASASGRHFPDETEQQMALQQAARVLARYGQLVTVVTTREVQDAAAPQTLIYQLITCWEVTSQLKSTIPTKSEWYAKAATHANWLTLDHNRLNTALQTRTGVQPTLTPDPLWVERRLAACLTSLLPALSADGEWSRAMSVIDFITERIFHLATRMQIDEAILLLGVITRYRAEISASTAATDVDEQLFRLAIAEREVLGYTSLWLGFARPLEALDPTKLAQSFDKSVEDQRSPYKVGAFRTLLGFLENVANGINLERETEGGRITPAWWLHHMASRYMAVAVADNAAAIVAAVSDRLMQPPAAEKAGDPQMTAVRIFDLLELLHKIQFHMQTVRAGFTRLETLRHDPSQDELWPELGSQEETVPAMEERLLLQVASVAPALATTSHDPSKPDLFGQAYRRLFDAAFHAIVEGRPVVATTLFPIIIDVADKARLRLTSDLSDERMREQAIFGTEPFVDMMELSGYALLMAHVDPPGIQPLVRATWDAIFASTTMPDLAGALLGVLVLQENNFAITSGGVGRTGRQMELARLLRGRGIISDFGAWPHPPQPTHEDPVVAVFAPDDMMGVHHDLADLFVVEYLADRPESGGHQLPRGADMLRESIDHQTRRRGGTDQPEEPDQ